MSRVSFDRRQRLSRASLLHPEILRLAKLASSKSCSHHKADLICSVIGPQEASMGSKLHLNFGLNTSE